VKYAGGGNFAVSWREVCNKIGWYHKNRDGGGGIMSLLLRYYWRRMKRQIADRLAALFRSGN